MTNALRFARAAPALAMSYVSVVITVVYGYFFFHEVSIHAFPVQQSHVHLTASFVIFKQRIGVYAMELPDQMQNLLCAVSER